MSDSVSQLSSSPGHPRAAALLISAALAVALLSGCAHVKPQAFNFVQMCDPQLGFYNYQADLARLKQAVSQVNDYQPDFVVICGDLVHTPDAKSFFDFKSAISRLRVPAYCAPGNHDLGNVPSPKSLNRFRKEVGKDYFYFDHKGCRFLVLNTQLWKSPVPDVTAKQDQWLQKALQGAAKRRLPVFVVEHYPPFVKTPDEPDAYFNLPGERRKRLLREFAEGGVVAVLAGHTHTTSSHRAGGIEVVTSETTSKNFDKRPFGFRVWRVEPGGSYLHQFVPLADSGPVGLNGAK